MSGKKRDEVREFLREQGIVFEDGQYKVIGVHCSVVSHPKEKEKKRLDRLVEEGK